jgi:hypothetical protein
LHGRCDLPYDALGKRKPRVPISRDERIHEEQPSRPFASELDPDRHESIERLDRREKRGREAARIGRETPASMIDRNDVAPVAT